MYIQTKSRPAVLSEWMSAQITHDGRPFSEPRLLSLAFVDRRTYREITQGRASLRIADRYRLWYLTKLPIFELSQSELLQYEVQKYKSPQLVIFEKIAVFHVDNYRATGQMPVIENWLVQTSEKTQDKRALARKLAKLYGFTNDVQKIEPKSGATELDAKIVENCVTTFKSILNGSTDVYEWRKQNATTVRELRMLISVILDAQNPYEEYKRLVANNYLLNH